MEDREKILKEALEQLEIPESLKPENMEKLLDEADKKETPKKKNTRVIKMAAMAASMALVLLVGVGVQKVARSSIVEDTAMTEAVMESTDGSFETETAEDAGNYEIPGVLHSAKSYDEINDLLEEARKKYEKENGGLFGRYKGFDSNVVYEEAITEDAAATTGSAKNDYSDTNVRTQGVDEGDVVKTDGEYIYRVLSYYEVEIIKIDNGKMKTVGTIDLSNDDGFGYVQEMYLKDNRLIVITDWSKTKLKTGKRAFFDYSYTEEENEVRTFTYDISDKSSPKKLGCVSVEGRYRSSRFKDGHVYVMTTYGEPIYYYCYSDDYKNIVAEDVIPQVNDEYVAAEDILLPEETYDEPFFVVTSVDVKKPSVAKDTKAVMGYVDNIYVSNDSIFFYTIDYSDGRDKTTIVKFSYEDGKIIPKTATSVNGTIDDSFCIDENEDGYLRVAATARNENWDLESSLYIFDKNLRQTGCITNFAGNEGIKSCRFMGDVGFVVTFRNTDPLFAIDLSNPRKPEIISELTLPGFSEYLHGWNESLLFGMGYDADEETGRVGNVKLSMFDVSDLKNTKEVTTKILDVTSANILDGDYKSICIDPKKNLIGFHCTNYEYDDDGDWKSEGFYKVYMYSEKDGEFTEKLSVDLDYAYDASMRGLYAGDYFYLVGDEEITSYSLKNFSKVDTLE